MRRVREEAADWASNPGDDGDGNGNGDIQGHGDRSDAMPSRNPRPPAPGSSKRREENWLLLLSLLVEAHGKNRTWDDGQAPFVFCARLPPETKEFYIAWQWCFDDAALHARGGYSPLADAPTTRGRAGL